MKRIRNILIVMGIMLVIAGCGTGIDNDFDEVGDIKKEEEGSTKELLGYKHVGDVELKIDFVLEDFEVRYVEYTEMGEEDIERFENYQNRSGDELKTVEISYKVVNETEYAIGVPSIERIVDEEGIEYTNEDYVGVTDIDISESETSDDIINEYIVGDGVEEIVLYYHTLYKMKDVSSYAEVGTYKINFDNEE